MTCALASVYLPLDGSMMTAFGHDRIARPIGIAEWTPAARAS